METAEKETSKETATPSRGILICRKLVAEKREMQEQVRRDWEDPEMRAMFEKLIEKARNEAK